MGCLQRRNNSLQLAHEPQGSECLLIRDRTIFGSANLTQVGGHTELVESDRAAFSADGSIAYFSTRFTSAGANSAVYAVRITDACPADLDGDGDADADDFFGYLDLFAADDPDADIDGDGDADADDFFAYLDLFALGC